VLAVSVADESTPSIRRTGTDEADWGSNVDDNLDSPKRRYEDNRMHACRANGLQRTENECTTGKEMALYSLAVDHL